MKKSLLLLIPTLFLVAACKQSKPANDVDPSDDPIPQPEPEPEPEPQPEPGPHVDPCPEGEHIDANQDMVCDKCGYPVEYQHAASLSGTPNAPFYLKVGEQKELKAELSPTPQRDLEKTFTWSSGDSKKAKVTVNSSNSAKAIVEGVSEGKVTISAQNDYRSDFRKDFYANVIDYDANNTYLWEYESADRKQFGYDSKEKPTGNTEGVAILGGLNWEFTRSSAESLQSSKGAVGFGKGGAPENVKLINRNTRAVKKIFIETASANSLAKITVKVGDNTVIDNKETPNASDDFVGSVSTGNLENLTGDISIEYETPAYDPDRAEDPTYKKPGATYLKSIWITYEEETFDFVTEKTYDFGALYKDSESVFFKDNLPKTAKELVFEDEDFIISFAKLAQSEEEKAFTDYPKTNSNIEIKLKKNTEVIKQISFEYVANGSSTNPFNINSSILGGEPYDQLETKGGTSDTNAIIYRENVNAVQLEATKTNNVGIKSLTIKTVAGEHAVVKSVKLADGATPEKTEYYAGEKFDCTGLGNIEIAFTQDSIEPIYYSSSNLVFYDGQSYENPDDHSGASEILTEGTTYVVALFLGNEISVNIEPVEIKTSTFEKVSSNEDLENGSYLITAPSKKAILQGSANVSGDFGASKCISYLSDSEFGDEITINYLFENEFITLSKVGDVWHITNALGKNVGMTNSHGISVSASPAYPDWNISIGEGGIASMSIIDSADTPYFYGYGTSTFKFLSEDPANIVLYKLAE